MGYLTSELYNTEALIMVEQHQIDEVILNNQIDVELSCSLDEKYFALKDFLCRLNSFWQ